MLRILLIICSFVILAKTAFGFLDQSKVKRFDWKGIEVIWLNETSFPSYEIVFYFADGALADPVGRSSETKMTFDLLNAGTTRYKRNEINDNLEYYGVTYGANVVHEFSTYFISGLARDITPTLMKVCHLFRNATYPKNEVRLEKKKRIASIKQMVSRYGALANRVFRQISLKNTPFSRPVSGTIKDIKRITKNNLLKRLAYFNNSVKKKIFISAPKKTLERVQWIVENECKWVGHDDDIVRTTSYKFSKKDQSNKIYFLNVPKAKKIEFRIGRFLGKDEIEHEELMELSASYLGGGFTSKLMEQVRKKKGLAYGIYAYASRQKEYGRTGISTSTSDSKIIELFETVKKVVTDAKDGKIQENDFFRTRNYLLGSYPFKFETSVAYLNRLVFLEHIGKDFSTLMKFKSIISKYSIPNISKKINELFLWDNQVIFVLGGKHIKKDLKKLGKVVELNWRKFL